MPVSLHDNISHELWPTKKMFSLACVLGPCDLKRVWILARSYSIIFHHLPARTNHPIELEVMFSLPCSGRSSRCWRVKDIFFCPSNPGSPHGRFIPTHIDTLRHMFAALRSTTPTNATQCHCRPNKRKSKMQHS